MNIAGLTPKRKRFLTGLTIAMGLGAVMGLSFYFNLFSSLQLRTNDLLFQSEKISQGTPSDKIVIVGIDDKSLADLGQFQSWTRSDYAHVVDSLAIAGARAIVIDVLFSEPEAGDVDLAQSIEQAGTVIMPQVQTNNASLSGVYSQSFLKPIPLLANEAYALGTTNISPDTDGIVRKLPAVLDDGTPVPALSLAAVAKYLGRPSVLESGIDNGTLSFNGRNIPLVSGNQLLINYKHASNDWTSFPQVSFIDVLNNRVDSAVFKDKIVLIGATATGLGDYFWTPLGRMNGVEIHANAINMILDESFLKTASRPATVVSMVILALVCAYVTWRWKLSKALLACAVLLVGCVVGAVTLFDRGLLVNAFYPPVTVLGTVLAVNTYNVADERKQQGKVRKTFGRYVSPTVAEKILDSMEEGQLHLGGQEQEVTIMFADVRGYTGLSRKMEPSKLITLLNSYLTAIIEAVIENEGIVNKFAGDNIMAVWNAPETCDGHAARAVKAALAAQEALAEVWEHQPDMPRMEFGIGINTGIAVVGNMGSEDRLEYSVIGDTVNYASRITDAAPANKIWIGAATFDYVKNQVETTQMENVLVKGGKLPFNVFEVATLKKDTGT